MSGKKSWYIVDGYRPPEKQGDIEDYKGHECIMILNCNDEDAHVKIDVYFMDKPPVLGIDYIAPARRISAFRSDDESVFGELKLEIEEQYSLNITSDIGIVVQYGRMDINQSNLSYLATLGFAEG